MKTKSKEFRFRTSNNGIVELIESRNMTYSKGIESIFTEYLTMNMKVEYLERENQLLKQHLETLNSIVSTNQCETVKPKKGKSVSSEFKQSLVQSEEPNIPETINLENDVKNSLKNMFDD